MWWWLALGALALGCGRIGFDEIGGAGSGDSGSGNGDAAAPLCTQWNPFGAPALVPGVNGVSHETGPWVRADELAIYFSTDRGGNYDIYTATRPDRAAMFSTPVPVAGVNTASDDKNPTVTADGLTMFLDSNLSGNYDLYVATRPTTASAFSTPTKVPGLSDPTRLELGPALLADELGLYVTLRTQPSPEELWLATRTDKGSPFSLARRITELATSAEEGFACQTSDARELFFESSPGGIVRVFRAQRIDTSGPFAAGLELSQLTSGDGEDDPQISGDGTTIYFTSFRAGGVGTADLYYAQRTCAQL